jgi:uncharacterized protein (DUF2252 family)
MVVNLYRTVQRTTGSRCRGSACEQFWTWRDVEGRFCWGVDDFDESYWLPYTNDLVRLAASMKIVADAERLSIKVKAGCNAILEGYVQSLKEGGRP